MGVETERKYLVDVEKWVAAYKDEKHTVEQGYILNSKEKIVRVRIYGDKGFITIKGVSKGASRPEFEYEIPFEDAVELLNNFCGSVVRKIRHKILFHGKVWDVDEFKDENEGLLIAEIELKNEDEQFELPEWVTKEVTGDERFYNSNLSMYPFTRWNSSE